MNANVSACLWGAIELHFLWNKVFFYLADLKKIKNKIKQNLHQIKTDDILYTFYMWKIGVLSDF